MKRLVIIGVTILLVFALGVVHLHSNSGSVDPETGEYYPGTGDGAINPETGEFYPGTGGGAIDPGTGEYHPGTGDDATDPEDE